MKDTSFIAVDWGTSSFRLWAMTREGVVLAEKRSDAGMSTLTPADYEDVLEHQLSALDIATHVPAIICGMAGAAKGWIEARYIDLPAKLNTLSIRAIRAPTAGRDVRILPGLAKRDPSAPDVARGEETLILGAVLEHGVEGSICLPGTHSKWAKIENGEVAWFSTAMAGEVFFLLANSSILAHFMPEARGNVAGNPAFETAVGEALAAPEKLLELLFSVRSMPLLNKATRGDDMYARLSGLLMGLEIAGMRNDAGGHVTLISGKRLAPNYARAFSIAGLTCDCLDADEMARVGLFHAAKKLWPECVG